MTCLRQNMLAFFTGLHIVSSWYHIKIAQNGVHENECQKFIIQISHIYHMDSSTALFNSEWAFCVVGSLWMPLLSRPFLLFLMMKTEKPWNDKNKIKHFSSVTARLEVWLSNELFHRLCWYFATFVWVKLFYMVTWRLLKVRRPGKMRKPCYYGPACMEFSENMFRFV